MEIYLRNLLPTWKGLGKLETDFAKDNAHPIPLHHVKWANKIKDLNK